MKNCRNIKIIDNLEIAIMVMKMVKNDWTSKAVVWITYNNQKIYLWWLLNNLNFLQFKSKSPNCIFSEAPNLEHRTRFLKRN
jgi:hypothetical protein